METSCLQLSHATRPSQSRGASQQSFNIVLVFLHQLINTCLGKTRPWDVADSFLQKDSPVSKSWAVTSIRSTALGPLVVLAVILGS